MKAAENSKRIEYLLNNGQKKHHDVSKIINSKLGIDWTNPLAYHEQIKSLKLDYNLVSTPFMI